MEGYYYYILFWVGIIGLCLGSFYNVVILRSISNESIIFPPSKCPKCNHKLLWWHNIPIFSYLFLRGKCYFCKEKISVQYPIVEFITMLLFILSYIKFGLSIKTLFVIIWLSGLLIMTVTDLKTKLVDCKIAIFLCITGLLYHYLACGTCLNSIYGMLAGIVIVEAVARSGYLFAGVRAMGEADTYVMAALGAIFGLHSLPDIILYSLIFSMIFILPQFLYNQFKSNNKSILILFLMFTLSGIVFKLVMQNLFIFCIFIIFAIALVFAIVKSMRSEAKRTYLPFVPVLSTAALYALFFLNTLAI